MKRIYLTRQGYEKLRKELEYLKKVKRKEIAGALEYAISLGDLKENAEYQSAKEAQAWNERKIQELEHKLSCAEIIENLDTSEKVVYKLVSSEEADPDQGIISVYSPVGKSLGSPRG